MEKYKSMINAMRGGTGSHGIALALCGRGLGVLIRKEWRMGLDAESVQLVTCD